MVEIIKCIILEDEELAAKSMIKIASKIEKLELVGHFFNPLEISKDIDLSDIDLIFLDVEMPEVTGLDFIKSLTNPPRVIVTTSKKDFAQEAFAIDAVDFILKPIKMGDVLKALEKYEFLDGAKKGALFDTSSKSLFVKVDSQLINLKFNEIGWIEALGDYVGFHVGKKRYVVKSTLSSIESKMKEKNFIRVHRSFMVSIDHIKYLDDSSLVIGDKLIPISRGSRPALMSRLNLLN